MNTENCLKLDVSTDTLMSRSVNGIEPSLTSHLCKTGTRGRCTPNTNALEEEEEVREERIITEAFV